MPCPVPHTRDALRAQLSITSAIIQNCRMARAWQGLSPGVAVLRPYQSTSAPRIGNLLSWGMFPARERGSLLPFGCPERLPVHARMPEHGKSVECRTGRSGATPLPHGSAFSIPPGTACYAPTRISLRLTNRRRVHSKRDSFDCVRRPFVPKCGTNGETKSRRTPLRMTTRQI